MDRFMQYRRLAGKEEVPEHCAPIDRRVPGIRRAETVDTWPKMNLAVPLPKQKVEVPWETFPAGLRADVEAYLETLMSPSERTARGDVYRRHGWRRSSPVDASCRRRRAWP